MRNFIPFLLLALCLANTTSLFAQSIYWNSIKESSISMEGTRYIEPVAYQTFQLDLEAMDEVLITAPTEIIGQQTPTEIVFSLPDPNGVMVDFNIYYSPIMEQPLADMYPEIRTYAGYSDDGSYVRMDHTPQGFHAMVWPSEGGIYFIDPYKFGTIDPEYYVVYRKRDHRRAIPEYMNCGVEGESDLDIHDIFDQSARYGDCQHRTYRLALSATGEYTTFHGGTQALAQAAQVTSMNRVNGVFELELSIRMNIIGNNNLIVYVDGATDPFSNGNTGAMINENQTNTDAVIGSANYDIGHIFGTNSGGLAQLQSPCGGSKARGVTGSGGPIGDSFDIDYVAHEMGHQFGANHTQNNNCNRTSTTSMEPGSAATIMGYAGICAPNVQSNSDDYYHAISLQEMGAFITTGNGNNCPVTTALSNNAPFVTGTPGNITVPGSTPFALTATATDPDSNPILYCWEQMDPTWSTMPPLATSTSGPNFRSFDPTTEATRYFPNLVDLATGITPTWEVLSSVSRTMPFRVSVRDYAVGGGCSDHDDISVTVDATVGPFVVAYPSATGISWAGNTNETVTWNVAGTNGGSVSCSNVDIFLSTDGGTTYPTILADNVTNDGSHSILVPNTATTSARIMVMCEDGTFFDVSDNNFEITAATFDYTLGVTSNSASACQPANATYTVNVGSIGGYSDPVSLSVSGVPAGATATFGTSTIVPGNNTTLTISNTNLATPGVYSLVLQGNSTSDIKTETLALTINAGSPSSVTNSTPANGANNVAVPTLLTWTASFSNPVTYTVDIAADAGFSSIVQSTSGIAATSLLITGLGTSTTYYWRVRVDNACASSAYSSTFSFTTNNCGITASTDVPVNISASGTPTVTSTLNIGTSGAITDLNILNIDITHTWVNDLFITLESPQGTVVTLIDQICGGENDLLINLDDAGAAHTGIPCPPIGGGTFQADELLSAFNGEDPLGTWTLSVTDNANQDGGSVDGWSLEICAISNDYLLSTTSSTESECQGTNAVYTVDVASIGGYSDPVTLSVSGLPVGAVATFGTNPVTSGNNTTLTISNTGSVTPGTHTFVLNASSISGNQALNLDLEVLSGSPDAVTLLGPTDGASGVSTTPILSWNPSATSGVTYTVQVATDVAFSSLITNTSGITGTSLSLTGLSQTTQYFWRVQVDHTCGSSAYSSIFDFTTSTCFSYVSTNVPVNISNSGTPTVTSTVTVGNHGITTDVNVLGLDISHTWVNDLTITLTSPQGTVVSIVDQICGSQNNFLLNIDDAGAAYGTIPCPPIGGGTYQADGLMSTFNGENPFGDWILTITDNASQDGGALNSWTLEVCADPCQSPTIPTLSFDDDPMCSGSSTTLNITGTLNHATDWEIYTNTCGSGSIGSTSGSTFTISPASTTTYYVRGEGSCVVPGSCAQATLTVGDVTPPVAICQDMTVYLDGAGNVSIVAADVDNGSSDNCGTSNLSINTSAFTCADIGPNTVTLTVDDGNGNFSTCTSTITVEDTIPPVAICQDVTIYLDGTGTASITAADIDNGSFDNCAVSSISVSPNAFNCSDVGTNNVTLTVQDNTGNSSTCTANVTVADTTSPSANCHDITVYLDGSGNASIVAADVDNGSSDNCGTSNLSINTSAFTCADIGPNTVTLTVDDGNGNFSTCTSTVTVEDTTPPVAICQDMTIYLNSAGTASITAADINNGSLDNCSVSSLSVSPSTFNCVDAGTNTVTLTVQDNNGNAATCTGTVTVLDTIPPIAICQNFTVYLDGSGSGTITAADIDNGSSDACGIADLSLDQTNFVCTDIGVHSVTLTAQDNNGNSATCTSTVTVADTTSPSANCQDITIYLDGSGNASIVVADVNDGSSDNCAIVNSVLDVSDFTCANVGPNTVVMTITDFGGNSSSCTSTVTVLDTLSPVASCQSISIALNAFGNASISGTDIDSGSTDNCGIATVVANPNVFGVVDIGPNNVTLTVTDVNGNTSTCITTVVVNDNDAPIMICQDHTAYLDASGNATISGIDIDNGSSDPSGIASLSVSPNAFSCSHIGTNGVTLTATDNEGNSGFCSATVTVIDTVSPLAICQNATVTLDATGNGSITAADVDNGSYDNCGAVALGVNPSTFTCADVGTNTAILTVTDGNGNTSTCTATVTVNATLPATAGSITGSDNVCAGSTQTFSVPAIANANSYAWSVPTGWTGTSTTNSITVLVGSTGGSISVSGVNACGSGAASVFAITVNNIPTASFSDATSGLSVNFSDGSTNAPSDWSWDFGDGTSSTQQNPSHSYTISGTYLVCLSASNSCGTSSPLCQNLNVSGTGAYVWTGAVNTDWNTPTNWNPNGVPNGDNVTIPNVVNDPYLSGGTTGSVYNIDVAQDVVITVDATSALQITGDLNWTNWGSFAGDGPVLFSGSTTQQINGNVSFQNLNVLNNVNLNSNCYLNQGLVVDGANLISNGQLTVNSDASGTGWIMPFENGGDIIGDVTVERYIANNGFHFFGTPVNTPSLANELTELNPTGPNNAQVIASVNCSTDSTNINSPYGTIFEYNEGNPHPTACGQWGWTVRSAGTMTNARGYAARILQGNTITITGDVNDGNLSYGGLINGGGYGNGFHLVSNPYPSPMQWNFVPGFDAAGYFWLTSGSYSGTYQAYFSGTGHQVASMQGFFIRTGAGPSNFALTNADRISGDPTFFRNSAPIDDVLEIEVMGNGFADRSVLRFSNLATDHWDNDLDALKMPGNSNQPMIFTRNGEEILSVNSIRPVKEEKFVVLGFNCGEGGDGVFDFGFKVRTDSPPVVFIEDLLTGRSQQITDGATFSFSSEVGQDEERFLLHFFPTGSSTSNDELIIYQGRESLNISAPDDMSGSIVQIYDMLGQVVFSEQLNGNRTEIPNNHWKTGAYMVKVSGASSGMRKVFVK